MVRRVHVVRTLFHLTASATHKCGEDHPTDQPYHLCVEDPDGFKFRDGTDQTDDQIRTSSRTFWSEPLGNTIQNALRFAAFCALGWALFKAVGKTFSGGGQQGGGSIGQSLKTVIPAVIFVAISFLLPETGTLIIWIVKIIGEVFSAAASQVF